MDRKEEINTEISAIKVAESSLKARREHLESQLEQPLEHGDYGIAVNNIPFILLKRFETLELFGNDRGSGCEVQPECHKGRILGNIFRDLEAMSEDLEEFEVDDIAISTYKDGDWRIEQGSDTILIADAQKTDFVLGLRKLLATLKRKSL